MYDGGRGPPIRYPDIRWYPDIRRYPVIWWYLDTRRSE